MMPDKTIILLITPLNGNQTGYTRLCFIVSSSYVSKTILLLTSIIFIFASVDSFLLKYSVGLLFLNI